MTEGKRYSHWKIICKYIGYYLSAGNAHSVHSPFVFRLYREVISLDKQTDASLTINNYRDLLKRNKESHVCIYSKTADGIPRSRKIGGIASSSSVAPRYGRLLSRLVAWFNPAQILEIGTSLGISTMFLASNFKGNQFFSLEGCPHCAAKASENLSLHFPGVVEIVIGEFSQTLPEVLREMSKLDLIFIDGNHRKDAVLSYVEMIKDYVHDGTILVIDDIHWSPEMEEAWAIITKDQHVTVTIDLFFFGLLIFREGQIKEHFTLRF